MKVVVDFELCQSYAICVEIAPKIFEVDENDDLQILLENPPEEMRQELEEAVRLCPRQAIAIEEG